MTRYHKRGKRVNNRLPKKYDEKDLRKAFEAGRSDNAEWGFCQHEFTTFEHWKEFLKHGKKIGGFFKV